MERLNDETDKLIMKVIYSTLLFIAASMVSYSCVEPFDPKISDSNKTFLVVDGSITTGAGPHTVHLSKSVSLEENNVPITGASVSFEEENGNIVDLFEAASGSYQTSSIVGETGKKYKLRFVHGGNQYESSWETIFPSHEIDSVYFEVQTIGTTDREEDQTGVQLFIDSHGSEDASKYVRYEFEEAWKTTVTYPSYRDYIGEDVTQATNDPRYFCFKYDEPTGINIASSDGLSSNRISKHKLLFIIGRNERLTVRYSLLVKQYSMGEREYSFWKSLQDTNEELGSLFDTQPSNIPSNIVNLSDPDEVVLGYFSAWGVQEYRAYVNKRDVPHYISTVPNCNIDLDTLLKGNFVFIEDYESVLSYELQSGKFFYNLISLDNTVIGTILSEPRCSDCTLHGGTLPTPNFWED